jgi:hypothetical protein
VKRRFEMRETYREIHKEGERMEMDSVRLRVELNALAEVPIWESHKRGTNWLARIHKNPKAPGGLDREFADKARGDYYYMWPEDWKRGDVLEFAADYITGSRKRHRNRRYMVVKAIRLDEDGNGYVEVVSCSSKTEAFKVAEELRSSDQDCAEGMEEFTEIVDRLRSMFNEANMEKKLLIAFLAEAMQAIFVGELGKATKLVSQVLEHLSREGS